MTYLATGLIVIWAAALVFLLGRAFNFSRMALNNPASDKPYWNDKDYLRYYVPFLLRRRSIFEFAAYYVLCLFPDFFRRRGIFGLAVNPAKLTKVGRQYQKKAIRAEWITVAWLIAGIMPVVWVCSCLLAS
jgi:hypothetical protein